MYPLANEQAIGQWAYKICQNTLSAVGALTVGGKVAVEGGEDDSNYCLDGPGGRVSANDGLIEAVIVGLRADLEAVGQSARWERIATNLMISHMAGYTTRDLLSANINKRDNWTTDLVLADIHRQHCKPIAKKSPPALEPNWTREALTAVGIQNHAVLTPTIFSVWLWWTHAIGALDPDALDLTTTALSEMVALDDWGLGRGGWSIADQGRLFLACAQINRCLTFVHALRGDIERASMHLAGNTYCSLNVKVEQLLKLLRMQRTDIDGGRVAAEADNGFYYRIECATVCTLGTRLFCATTNTIAAIPTNWNDLVDLATDYWAKEPRNAVWNTVVYHGITLEAAANLVFSTAVEVGECSMRSRDSGGISHVFAVHRFCSNTEVPISNTLTHS
ncbi:hypothetical protein EYZ11_012847 [Aspergillus tanneri]|uniref:Uncharacterized protein n=1 Tax=Aspergillus tanneri TaxID=1220188 RepID=A0A4S3J1A9_9EURO|nr:hypothetical protein EYZ11_012847 [Aspergillus tanneri]